jgi:hypothetical protein
MDEKMLNLLQQRLGRTAIGASTARGMGPKGTISIARAFLQEFDLRRVRVRSLSAYRRNLDTTTDELLAALPPGGRHWGSARKFVNIFIRNCAYNRFMCEAYGLEQVEQWMEVPLDSHVAKGLIAEISDVELPRWTTVIGLTPEVSDRWQQAAQLIADREGFCRVHLDIRYWNGAHLNLPR